jgi:cellulose synthase/poly-beta-1,6-N-acetylglucosamine synthase-like glycosyltransferase
VFFVENMAALLPVHPSIHAPLSVRPTMAVLMPAHNEAAGIRTSLESVFAELSSEHCLVVIADNCTDETANIARAMGATVIERQDLQHQGKGFALDFGVRFLAQQPPDVVIVIDADCLVEPGTFARIAQVAIAHNRPVQACNLLQKPAELRAKDAISLLAFQVKNLVRPLGLSQLGFPCSLTGTGMAFPWSILHHSPLANGHIVEDMNLGLDLAIAGYPPLFCAEGKVTSAVPQQEKAFLSQRTRWEHGHLATIQTQWSKVFKAAVQHRRLDLLAIAFDLLVPPISLLMILWTVSIVVAMVAWGLGATRLPTILLSIEGLLLAIALGSTWAKYSREILPASVLLTIPLYILSKIPIYWAFVFNPQKAWIRTERDEMSP